MLRGHCDQNIWSDKAAHALTTISDAGTPSLDFVTSRMDDEWLLHSFVISETDTWNTMGSILSPGLPSFPCVLSQCSDLLHSNKPEEHRSPSQNHTSAEESERRRARRERNRIAAARCRDRRRMQTESLQNETEHLEQVKAQLEEEISGLEREKERLELVLEAHKPVCKMDE